MTNSTITTNPTLNQVITDYLQYLVLEKGRSPKTIENYALYLRRLIEVTGDIQIANLTPAHVSQFAYYLAELRLGRNTRNYHQTVVKELLRFCDIKDITALSANKVILTKPIRTEAEWLTGVEMERLLRAPQPNNLLGLRDKAILEVLFSTGLRVAELVSLNTKQINFDTRQFMVTGKGSKDRLVFISERAAKWLGLYLDQRYDGNEALFVEYASGDYGRLSVRSVQRFVTHYAKLALVKKRVSPHTFRHSFATNLLNNGAGIRSVQMLLGHESIATTQFYTHVTNDRLREVHEQFNVL